MHLLDALPQVYMPTTYFVTDYATLQIHALSFPRSSTAQLSRRWIGAPKGGVVDTVPSVIPTQRLQGSGSGPSPVPSTPARLSPCDNSTVDVVVNRLPADTFVFASFSNFQKLDPQVVDVWCAVLRRVPRSVLWLLRHDGAEVGVCVRVVTV